MFNYKILAVLSGKMTNLGTSDAGITKVLLDVPLRPHLGPRMGFSTRVLTQHAQNQGGKIPKSNLVVGLISYFVGEENISKLKLAEVRLLTLLRLAGSPCTWGFIFKMSLTS